MSTGTIAAKGRRAGKSPWVERLGRAGLVAKGVLYAVVGILAVQVALGGREESPDKSGALRTIAERRDHDGLVDGPSDASGASRTREHEERQRLWRYGLALMLVSLVCESALARRM